MKRETLKTFMLVVLIGISLLLSFTLWSYQPNSNITIGGEIIDNVMDVGGSDEETKRTLVQPTNIIFHTAGSHYGYINPMEREELYEQIQSWVITEYDSDYTQVSNEEPVNGVEIIFDEEIPMDMLDNLFVFAEEEVELPTWSMERMHIYFINDSKSLHLEFVSHENERVETALINDTNAYDVLSEKYTALDGEELREYIRIGEGGEAFYFPAGEVQLPTYSITPRNVEPDLFVNVLFTNPAVVRETDSQSIGETYFTDSRQMSVYNDRKRLEYINHVTPSSSDDTVELTKTELLDRSIDHINGHSGWTGDYRLKDVSIENNRVGFQLYYDGYPVFSSSLAMIEQVWSVQQNNVQLIGYDRPLYTFDNVFRFWEVDPLMSGSALIQYIENQTDWSMNDIQDIRIGYEMNFQIDELNSEYIELIPSWFVKENNTWQKVDVGTDLSLKGVE